VQAEGPALDKGQVAGHWALANKDKPANRYIPIDFYYNHCNQYLKCIDRYIISTLYCTLYICEVIYEKT
jgi:hypothetical protein